MNRGIINKAYLAVFYFQVKGVNYGINDPVSREKARSNFGHANIDVEILKEAIGLYTEYLNLKFIEFISE